MVIYARPRWLTWTRSSPLWVRGARTLNIRQWGNYFGHSLWYIIFHYFVLCIIICTIKRWTSVETSALLWAQNPLNIKEVKSILLDEYGHRRTSNYFPIQNLARFSKALPALAPINSPAFCVLTCVLKTQSDQSYPQADVDHQADYVPLSRQSNITSSRSRS